MPDLTGTDDDRRRAIAGGIEWTARWSLRWILIVGAAVLLGLIINQAWSIVLPVFLALLLASLLTPMAAVLEQRLRLPAALAAAASVVGLIGAVVGTLALLTPSVAGQTDDIATQAAAGLQQTRDWVRSSDILSEDQVDTALGTVQDRLTDAAGSVASGVLVGVGAVGSAAITLVLTLILTFLFLKDGRHFLPWLSRLVGRDAGAHLTTVAQASWQTLGGFIRTQALVSLVDAVLIGAVLLVVGVPLAVPLAVLTFLGGFVPIVGAFVVGAVAVLVALVGVGWTGALVVLVAIVVVQQIEGNLLSPWLQSRTMSLHPAVVLLSVTLGGTLFGISGAFFAVPVVAVIAVVLRYLDETISDRTEPDVAENDEHEQDRRPVRSDNGA